MSDRKLAFIVKSQHPLVLHLEDTLGHACRCMSERRVGAVLVTDRSGHLKGIFTGRDAVRVLGADIDAARMTLAETMTPDPRTLAPQSTTIDALRMMQDGGFRHVPVVSHGKIVGIVSRADFTGEELEHLDDENRLWECIW